MTRPTKITFEYVDEEGYIHELSLPAKYEVCPRCDGRGVHDNPAFSNGFTSDEMAEEGPEFVEDYMAGVYDVRCSECKGERVVPVPDTDRADPGVLAKYEEMLRADAEVEAAHQAEMRFCYGPNY